MWISLWLFVTCAALIVWSVRHLQISTAARHLPPLHARLYPDAPDDHLPPISFLVAGKEEEENIAGCLKSMLAQDYPRLQIISINDRSNDRTGQIMDSIAAADPRLTALHVRELPPGWLGKNNAMRTGLEHADGEWLCFTDADCILLTPRALRIAMLYARERKCDFLSILPAHDTSSFWERVIQPACSGIMMIWFNPLRVNNPARKTAYANGAFMLMKRACYEQIGGHDAVKTEFNEDMRMAQLAKSAGQRLHVVSNTDLYTVRMYQSFREIWNGWSRIFFGCFGSLRRLLITIMLIWVFSLGPWVSLGVAGYFLTTAHAAKFSPVFCAALLACLAQLTVMIRFYRLNYTNPIYALLYPLGVAIGFGAVVNAIRRRRRRSTITWRGTTYNATPPVATASLPDPVAATTTKHR